MIVLFVYFSRVIRIDHKRRCVSGHKKFIVKVHRVIIRSFPDQIVNIVFVERFFFIEIAKSAMHQKKLIVPYGEFLIQIKFADIL